MRSDAEFELWISEVDQRWKRKFRQMTWQLAALTVACWASTLALVFAALP